MAGGGGGVVGEIKEVFAVDGEGIVGGIEEGFA